MEKAIAAEATSASVVLLHVTATDLPHAPGLLNKKCRCREQPRLYQCSVADSQSSIGNNGMTIVPFMNPFKQMEQHSPSSLTSSVYNQFSDFFPPSILIGTVSRTTNKNNPQIQLLVPTWSKANVAIRPTISPPTPESTSSSLSKKNLKALAGELKSNTGLKLKSKLTPQQNHGLDTAMTLHGDLSKEPAPNVSSQSSMDFDDNRLTMVNFKRRHGNDHVRKER
nr:hypothetical protein Iba_chr01dCG4420 [Ipomoea batatas]